MRSSSERVSISAVMLSINAICQGFHLSCSRLIDKSESINFLIKTDREDFTCKYRDDASNTTYGIGECIYSFSTCFPPNEPVSGLTFNYSATLTSGIITVLNVNKSLHATVYCYKTYNVLINASLELPDECTTQNNGTSSLNNASGSNLAVILGPVFGGACVLILIIIVIARVCCGRKYESDYQANTMTTMEEIDRQSPQKARTLKHLRLKRCKMEMCTREKQIERHSRRRLLPRATFLNGKTETHDL